MRLINARTLPPPFSAESGRPRLELNERAVAVIRRIQDKLTGRDFETADALAVAEQVDRLIRQARSHENLCQLFIGWCVVAAHPWMIALG